jgi:hypothetical protein
MQLTRQAGPSQEHPISNISSVITGETDLVEPPSRYVTWLDQIGRLAASATSVYALK